MNRLILLLFAFILSLPLAAADKKALVGGTLVNGLGSIPILDSVILIDGETIEKVGTVESLPVPGGYEIISTDGMTVIPGLWDMHVHLMIRQPTALCPKLRVVEKPSSLPAPELCKTSANYGA